MRAPTRIALLAGCLVLAILYAPPPETRGAVGPGVAPALTRASPSAPAALAHPSGSEPGALARAVPGEVALARLDRR